ncbi:TonB-dependent receptor plug domain-containing protein [Alkalimarinus alittae]|uniref:TonB-dependent receptor n=1 Tax=Alkalimarinus alittae TaxID=2961619 RepID=A0ABY6N2Y2_9ALTE|nr:TonB-dependent receptor [Alkalimarinus alittae]UZE96470.1 TonB-dependent receptor [Alkalimarinus alittae]
MLYLNTFKTSILASAITSLALSSGAHAEAPVDNSGTIQPTEAREIVISASRIEMAREASGSAVTVLDSDYLEQNQVRVISDVLRDIPGVSVSRGGGLGSPTSVRIRGAEANQTLVLIDGIEVNDVALDGEFNFGNLLNLEVERVEVLRGAQSALWGSDAMGGVINIVTKKGSGALNGKATIEGGSYDTHQETLSINAGTENYNYALSGTLLNSNGISTANEERGNTEKDGYENATINFKGGIQVLDNLSVDLVLRYLDADVETDAFMGGVGAVDSAENSETTQQTGKLSAKLDLLDEQWVHTLGFSANDTDNKMFNTGSLNYKTEGYKEKIEYQTDLFLNSSLVEKDDLAHRLTFTAEHEKEEFKNEDLVYVSAVDQEMDMSGFVFEYGASINDQYYVTVAGRRDLNSQFQNANTYRLTFAGWIVDNVRVHTSKGTGIKNPTFYELYGSSSTYTGNAYLNPEKSSTWDVGSEYHFDAVDGYVDLTYFHTDVDNLIVASWTTTTNMPSDSTIQGVELSMVLNPTNNFRLDGSFTYTDTDDGNGNELVRRPKHSGSINGSYLLPDIQTRITAGAQYVGKQDDFAYDAMWNRSQITLSEYTLVNIALSHQFNEHIELFGRVDNLLDEEYEEVFSYGTMGINAMVGISIKGSL